jgi:hypothetical protein
MIGHWVRTTLLLASVPYVACRKPRFEPIKVCGDCIPRETIVAPGIGFDLTTSYGYSLLALYLLKGTKPANNQPFRTASIRFHNGSSINVGKVWNHPRLSYAAYSLEKAYRYLDQID